MPRDHLPFFLFYPADWTQDVQTLTFEARGAWITVLCALHVAPERGRHTFRIEELEQLLGPRALYLLDAIAKVADVTWTDGIGNDEGIELNEAALITIVSRRMVRDEHKRILEVARKRRYDDAHPTRRRRSSDAEVTGHISEVISHTHTNTEPERETVKDNLLDEEQKRIDRILSDPVKEKKAAQGINAATRLLYGRSQKD